MFGVGASLLWAVVSTTVLYAALLGHRSDILRLVWRTDLRTGRTERVTVTRRLFDCCYCSGLPTWGAARHVLML
jgi:hypothetical protein